MSDDPRLDPAWAERLDYDDATIEAVGKLTDAFETIEVARGHLYAFHRMTGTAGTEISDAVKLLRDAGHEDVAERVRAEVLGRDVIGGHWTFQLVEEYDGNFYGPFRRLEIDVRNLVGGHRHLHEAALKRGLTGGYPSTG
ncbi:MAG: hypothetical protein ACTHOG_01240 [Marmoricola sp.]